MSTSQQLHDMNVRVQYLEHELKSIKIRIKLDEDVVEERRENQKLRDILVDPISEISLLGSKRNQELRNTIRKRDSEIRRLVDKPDPISEMYGYIAPPKSIEHNFYPTSENINYTDNYLFGMHKPTESILCGCLCNLCKKCKK